MTTNYQTEATFENGIMKWISNGRVPPKEYVKEAFEQGFAVNVEACDKERESQTGNFLSAYRKSYAGPSAEERMEALAAHGPGKKIVNVVTGHEWTT